MHIFLVMLQSQEGDLDGGKIKLMERGTKDPRASGSILVVCWRSSTALVYEVVS